ncbi:helix-turn-helix domain-containing protein [Streptomyces sp. NPDC088745]|uniref:helix-turn-helix domain-containing protein n=1 Tax=Streptomyces sp. NPDC088745 TaxID=3365884 RepID=UPI00380081CA
MVKKRQSDPSGTPGIPEVRFHAPGGAPAGVEVLTLAALRANACADSIAATHRPDFHHLLRLERGDLPLMVDFASYRVRPGEWLWVRPGQVHRWDGLYGAEGTLVLFEAGFPDPATSAAARLDDPFGPTVRGPGAAAAEAAGRALEHLHAEYRALRDAGAGPGLPPDTGTGTAPGLPPDTGADPRLPPDAEAEAESGLALDAHLSVLRHLLAVLLLRLAPVGESAAGCAEPDAFLRFRTAVERDFARTRRVDDYARELGYAPRTLSRATLSAAGVGAKEFIDRRVVLEAKRLLAHSDHSASRVAALLGFRDAANFGKYFQQRTGESPLGFRTTARGGGPGPTSAR